MQTAQHRKTVGHGLRQERRDRHIRFERGKDRLQAADLANRSPLDPGLGQRLHGGGAETAVFLPGLQLGLASAAGITAAGLFSLLAAFPPTLRVMMIAATAYLIYLAWKIASSPVGATAETSNGAHASPAAGFLLGVTNPKAYLAFASLLASYTLIKDSARQDAFTKWSLLVAVMIAVDIAWLYAGVFLRGLRLSSKSERALNVALGLTVLVAAGLAFA